MSGPDARQRLRGGLLRLMAGLPWPPSHQPADPPQRVLVMRPDHLGDVLMATPALAQLRAARPAGQLAAAVGPWAVDLLQHGPPLDEIIAIPFPPFDRNAARSALAPYRLLWRTARQLRAARFDAVLILRPDYWWGALLARVAGIPHRLGYAVPAVAPFLTVARPLPAARHASALNLGLVDALLGQMTPASPLTQPLIFEPTAAERRRVAALLQPLTDRTGPLIALQPGAGGSLTSVKLWPTARWVTVARTLVEIHGARLVLTGSLAEAALTDPIAAALPAERTLNLAGQTDLGTLGALFAVCQLVLGVDSGGLHLATATAPRTLRLYGPSDPILYGPWGDPRRHQHLHAGYQCPVCGQLERTTVCPLDCMGAIAPDMVLTRALALLANGE